MHSTDYGETLVGSHGDRNAGIFFFNKKWRRPIDYWLTALLFNVIPGLRAFHISLTLRCVASWRVSLEFGQPTSSQLLLKINFDFLLSINCNLISRIYATKCNAIKKTKFWLWKKILYVPCAFIVFPLPFFGKLFPSLFILCTLSLRNKRI